MNHNRGRPKNILKREDLERAMKATTSNMAAARFLGVSYFTYREWAKSYKSHKEGVETLWDEHKCAGGKGVRKFLNNRGDEPALTELLEGRLDIFSYRPDKVKHRLISEGVLEEKCIRCGFKERRVLDYKIPLVLNFKDGNKKNWRRENLELICYNCYFLNIGDLFTKRQMKGLEDYTAASSYSVNKTNWDLDPYNEKRLKELGLDELIGEDKITQDLKEIKDDDGEDLISYAF